MASPRYTILIVPNSRAPLRKLQISSRIVSYALIGFALCTLASLGTMIHYVMLYKQAQTAAGVEQENQALKASLKQSEVLTDQLNHKISVLTRLTSRLKKIAGMPRMNANRKAQQSPTRLGMGGVTIGSEFDPQKLVELKRKADFLEKNLVKLNKYFSDHKNLPTVPSIIPAAGVISSSFGTRRNPFTGLPDFHEGVDISNDSGTPVVATASGIIAFAGIKRNLGFTVEVEHPNDVATLYGHLKKIAVRGGDYVRRGQIIGYMGSTGNSTGPHLHYEIHVKNQAVNPRSYLF